ncbi:ADP-ribosyltransferase [Mucilaginibacter dorajii]|uniref:NAD(+)--protein-arginine ADP-ribosyltransferase n=1 Tax=Mucilaginibacter dorajii TaxID=692994 RepID=A0ABP7Q4B1_9SPHI|nr:ADP-ribosyltransferase domain-containing protein [Mucilaginibacter dorajii]MCS3732626.1 hypothetical protein [Mucilaginibacter dorajii]
MKKLDEYVHQYCSRELIEVQKKLVNTDLLRLEEHALIYRYTEDAYETLNEQLRLSGGQNSSDFGKFLNKTLAKLPDYEDIVYRAVNLTAFELQKYLDAYSNNTILVEHAFISASKSKAIAYQFGNSCQFRIFSRNGKDIEAFAKYGLYHPQNEKEVLFKPNSRFIILEVTKQGDKTLITLEEVR